MNCIGYLTLIFLIFVCFGYILLDYNRIESFIEDNIYIRARNHMDGEYDFTKLDNVRFDKLYISGLDNIVSKEDNFHFGKQIDTEAKSVVDNCAFNAYELREDADRINMLYSELIDVHKEAKSIMSKEVKKSKDNTNKLLQDVERRLVYTMSFNGAIVISKNSRFLQWPHFNEHILPARFSQPFGMFDIKIIYFVMPVIQNTSQVFAFGVSCGDNSGKGCNYANRAIMVFTENDTIFSSRSEHVREKRWQVQLTPTYVDLKTRSQYSKLSNWYRNSLSNTSENSISYKWYPAYTVNPPNINTITSVPTWDWIPYLEKTNWNNYNKWTIKNGADKRLSNTNFVRDNELEVVEQFYKGKNLSLDVLQDYCISYDNSKGVHRGRGTFMFYRFKLEEEQFAYPSGTT